MASKEDLLDMADILNAHGWQTDVDDFEEDLERFTLRGDYDPDDQPETKPEPGFLTSKPEIKKATKIQKKRDHRRSTELYHRSLMNPPSNEAKAALTQALANVSDTEDDNYSDNFGSDEDEGSENSNELSNTAQTQKPESGSELVAESELVAKSSTKRVTRGAKRQRVD
jgi:hypothetical protein